MGGIVDKFTFVLFLDSSNFTKGTSTAEKAVNGLKTTMLSAYTAIGGIDLFHNMLTTYTDTARSVGRLSEVTGESIKTIQAWQYTMEASGGPVSSINAALMAFNEEMAQVKNYGTSTHMALFARLGINIKPLEKGSKLLLDTAKVLKTLNDTQAFDFGRSLGLDDNTIILLRRYGDGLSSVIRQNEKYSIIKKRDIETTKEWDKMMANLKFQFLGLSQTISPEMMELFKTVVFPQIKTLFEYMIKHKKEIKEGILEIGHTFADIAPGAATLLNLLDKIVKATGKFGASLGGIITDPYELAQLEGESPLILGYVKQGNSKIPLRDVPANIAPWTKFVGQGLSAEQLGKIMPAAQSQPIYIENLTINTKATNAEGIQKDLRRLPRSSQIAPQLAGAVAQ